MRKTVGRRKVRKTDGFVILFFAFVRAHVSTGSLSICPRVLHFTSSVFCFISLRALLYLCMCVCDPCPCSCLGT